MKVFDELSLYSELQGCIGVCVCVCGGGKLPGHFNLKVNSSFKNFLISRLKTRQNKSKIYIYINTHTHIYIYIYIYIKC